MQKNICLKFAAGVFRCFFVDFFKGYELNQYQQIEIPMNICYYFGDYKVLSIEMREVSTMKKRIVSILLVAMMILAESSMVSFAGVTPGRVTDLKSYSAYKSVVLEWSPTANAAYYDIYRNNQFVGRAQANDSSKRAYDNGNMMAHRVWTGKEGGSHDWYYVIARSADGTAAERSAAVKDWSVFPMFISITFNQNVTLSSHNSSARRYFKRGQTVQSYSYRFGKYIFKDWKGNIFYVNYTRVRSPYAHYWKSYTYSDKEAEYFVNTSGIGSDTKYLIWANLYTQKLYIFYGTKGHFRLHKTFHYGNIKGYKWAINSGKAVAPTPTGMSFNIYKKAWSNHGVPYWLYFHSQTSLHGQVGNDDFNVLRSGGCIRNPNKYAYLMYKWIPIGTRLIVY